MFTQAWATEVARFSPTGRVPVLLDHDITVWDTTAIIEYLRNKHSDTVRWPEPAHMRAQAQSISGEMHSGFLAIRDELPQNLRARHKFELNQLSEPCRNQITRIDQIWTDCREKYGESGEWLFGAFSIADILFTPVALRFVTYSIPVGDKSREFIDAVQDSKSVQQWIKAAQAESESIPFIDKLVPAELSPLTLG